VGVELRRTKEIKQTRIAIDHRVENKMRTRSKLRKKKATEVEGKYNKQTK